MKAALLHQRAVIKQHLSSCGEEEDPEHCSSSKTKPLLLDDDRPSLAANDKHCKGRKSSCWICRVLRTLVALVLLAVTCFVLCWLALYTGIYDRDPTCPIEEWSYEPWCGDAVTHDNTSRLQDALSPEQWLHLREKYHQIVGERYSSLDSNWADLYKELLPDEGTDQKQVQVVHNNGFLIPIEVKRTPNEGRGVYTTVDIPKGTKVWDNRFQAVFPNECAAKQFLMELNNEQACDAMIWGYSHNIFGDGYKFVLDLDGHGYTNHCTEQDGCENVAHHFENEMNQDYYGLWPFFGRLAERVKADRNRPGAYGLYATRDISAGEELYFDYHKLCPSFNLDWHSILLARSLPVKHWFIY